MATTISDLLEKLASSAQKMVKQELSVVGIRRLMVVVDEGTEFQHVADRHEHSYLETTFYNSFFKYDAIITYVNNNKVT